jgi:hypothetical protein
MSFIIYPQEGGKLAVIIPAGDVQAAIKDVPANTEYAIVDSIESIDNEYFNGFVYQDGAVVADIAACKSIHLDKFRAARAPKLAALDIAYMKAIEVEDSVAASQIAVAKQELRDITELPLPNTLPEIKETWPAILT